ncbi:interferon-induced protein with tetratricopeptide repeats 1-like [Rhinolophus ferrumequinum]|uniref:Interferon induced protein with tetratricopeptide repeats 3 n=1 Tax=Rhinolophus ferrumequinum TaxID=59479 RepID=A0A671G0P7_RHIFE|nr:interferon-induced protein with tetratricopeptide repeats 1-like [Rhinolophus ferrumequinum]
MSDESNGNLIKDRLVQLRCHFTWNLLIEDVEVPDLENRVFDNILFLDTKNKGTIYNLLAYVKHLKGQNEEALESLKEAEDLIQQEHANQSDLRSLVTWGNYAWLCYHMGRLADARIYLDKVENTCKKFASPNCYRMECPEMDCEEGWALLKCGGKNYERAKACFEKALEVDAENPEFSTGYAIATYRLDSFNKTTQISEAFCLHPLKKAIRLNPENAYIKALLAVKLQDVGQEAEGEKYIEEALTSESSQTYVFRYAAKFYRRKGSVDKALQLLKKALQKTPNSVVVHHQRAICYKTQMIQIKKTTNWQPRGRDREDVHKLLQRAISDLETTLQLKPSNGMAYVELADMYAEIGQHRMAEDIFQKALCLKVCSPYLQQHIYYRYGRFQELQKKSAANAIIYYLKVVRTEEPSSTRDKSMSSLEKLALKKLQRNDLDIENLSILGFIYKLKGEINEALEYYERALRLSAGVENSVGYDW